MFNQPDRRFNLPPIAERLISNCKSNKCKNAKVDKERFNRDMIGDWLPFQARLEYERMKLIELPRQYLVFLQGTR